MSLPTSRCSRVYASPEVADDDAGVRMSGIIGMAMLTLLYLEVKVMKQDSFDNNERMTQVALRIGPWKFNCVVTMALCSR